MRRRVRAAIGATTLAMMMVTALATIATPTGASDDVDSRTFNVSGPVLVADIDPVLPGGQGFELDSPTGPSWVDDARDAEGDLTIKVDAQTEYRVYDPNTGTWPRATYEETVVEGEEIRVGGRQYQVGSQYELFARYVWRPVKPDDDRPASPPPDIEDFAFQRTFNVLGTTTQLGVRVPTYSGVYCGSCGFVVGELVETNNDHVATIAAAHHGKLPVTVTELTKYYIEEEDGSKRQGSLADIEPGVDLRVAGKYGFTADDWVFIANYVWIPNRTGGAGAVEWQTAQSRTDDGSDDTTTSASATYTGENVAGTDEVFPGRTDLQLEWSLDSVTGAWTFSGTFEAGDLAGNGTIFGTIDGTWTPSTGSLEGDALITGGTGRHHDIVGVGGKVSGLTAPGTSPPSDIPSLSFALRATRS